MKAQNRTLHTRQKGTVLVISLVFLLILTLIGLSGMRTSVLEEKMAGNSRNQNLAFQSAEAGLHGAERYIDSLVTASDFGGAINGLVAEVTDDPNYLDAATWVDASSIEYNSGLSIINSQPRYIIKYVGQSADDVNAGLNLGGYGEHGAGSQITTFRITSRGTGGTDNARVTLQTNVGKRF